MDNIKEQFGEIYDQYIEKIYRFVYLKVDSEEAAEDLTSKVFLKGWEAYKNQKSDAANSKEILNPGAFLYQIARNTVIDYYREKGKVKIVSTESTAAIADPRTDFQHKAAVNLDIGNIKSAMQKLKKDYQDVIIWHYLDDMPIAKIARTLGKPEGTIRVMLHRGLKELKDIVQES
ncbi:MAG: RNA polymerase sigma factor [Candidatus Staskawiczbacteria bacterium]|nr:RNA polymerase sigma factor [Candidatus Staskawiczbacteria bacterium]